MFASPRGEDGFGYEQVMFVLDGAKDPATPLACLVREGEGWSLHSSAGPIGAWRTCPTAVDLLGAPSAGAGCAGVLLLAALGCLL